VADVSAEGEPDVDGLLGWALLKDSSFTLDAVSGRLLNATSGNAPGPASAWQQLPVRKKSAMLVLEIPGQNGQPGGIVIDTGSGDGVDLAPAKWREWRAAHPTAPATLHAYYRALPDGLHVREMVWAEELTVGPLTLTNVTVEEADAVFSAVPGYVATLGLAALRRQNVVVDGEKGIAYFSRQQVPAKAFPHNRLGAVFVPGDRPHDPLVAHVAASSPADEAGIRNGDILLKVDGDDATQWLMFPYPQSWLKFSAGTKLALTLKRGDKEFAVTVTLRDILGPGALTPKPSLYSRPAQRADPAVETVKP
jgi:membrane-associated protease RseP (regulator of RpoE activity)